MSVVAWNIFSAANRDAFRAALSVDDATCARGRGWALLQALIAFSYYPLEMNRLLVVEARRWLAEVLADRSPSLRPIGPRRSRTCPHTGDEGHRLLTYLVPRDARVTVLTNDGTGIMSTPITVSELAELVDGGAAAEDGVVEPGEPVPTGHMPVPALGLPRSTARRIRAEAEPTCSKLRVLTAAAVKHSLA